MNKENINTYIVLIVLGIVTLIVTMMYISTGIPENGVGIEFLNPCDPRNWFW